MDDAGQLIYRRRTERGAWLIVVFVVIGVMLGASKDRSPDWEAVIASVVVATLLCFAIVWIAMARSGRTRLAEVVLRDGILIVRRGHMLDRGKVFHIPRSETGNWRKLVEHYGRGRRDLEVVKFDHGATTYILEITGSQHADLDVLNAWVGRGEPIG